MGKKTVIMDFDGVIHSYMSGWKGATVIPDIPVPGIKEAIAKLREEYLVVVVSTRCFEPGGVEAIEKWLRDNDIQVDKVTDVKPPAVISIDDRAICFDGNPNTLLTKVKAFRPWWDKMS